MKIFTPLSLLFLSLTAAAQSGSQEFTTSGSFTVPAGVTEIFVEVVGAGGNGGYNGTGGGGGGGYASGNFTVTPGAVLDVAIGVPGLGGVTGTTIVEDLLYATGGENGVSVPNPEIGGGGTGGFGNGGNISNFTGGKGGGGYYTYFGGGGGGAAGVTGNGGDGGNTIAWVGICLTPGGDGGVSGGAPAGNGGKGAGFVDAFCGVSDPAASGANYGAGGGGGNGNGGGPGNGAPGYARITWCALDNSTVTDETTITAVATSVAYQWYNCSTGEIIEGEVNQSYTATVSGSYAVILKDEICEDTSACVDIEIITIGINELNANNIKVAPNPFTNTIQVAGLQGYHVTFNLMNTFGQSVWSGNNLATDFDFLPSGIYILNIKNENNEVNKMLVKE